MHPKNKQQARRTSGRRKSNTRIKELETEFTPRSTPRSKTNLFFTHHAWVALSTLGQLWRTPLSTLMTSSVIAIALALPMGLYVLLTNVQQLSSSWDDSAQISLFLKSTVSETQALNLRKQLGSWEDVNSVSYLSSQQALQEFKQASGFGEALEVLDENPLPAVLLIQPKADFSNPEAIETLFNRLQKLSQVDQALLDMQWVRRLSGIIDVGKRGVYILATLLSIAILLVIGNTIRLTIFNKREEILVTKLIGATNRFIRRPFLYTGFWYGLFGATMAWLLVAVLLGLLKGPFDELARLYDSQFSVGALDGQSLIFLFLTGIFLGLLGSWLAVGRHMQAIEPK